MSALKHRFLLVSDMHYTTELKAQELDKIYPGSNTSAAAGLAFGKTQREKVEKIYTDITREHERSALDAVLVLGDLSVDDYGFRNLPINYCKQFKEECLDRLPCPSYVIPGNHDSYPNEEWKRIFGTDREFAFEIGDCAFIMADTFAGIPATGASGADVSAIDTRFLKSCLEKYADKRIFLCAHYIDESPSGKTLPPEVRDMIKGSSDLVMLFRGHTHVDNALELEGKWLVDIGGYGYCGIEQDYGWEFNIYASEWAWGYQILEIYDDKAVTYHVRTDNVYDAVNGVFEIKEQKSGEVTVLL